MLTIVNVAAAVTLAAASAAEAPVTPSLSGGGVWNNVTCESDPAGCDLSVGNDGGAGSDPNPQSGRDAPGAGPSRPRPSNCQTFPVPEGAIGEYWAGKGRVPPGRRVVLRVCPNVAPQWLSVDPVGQGGAPPADPVDLAAAARDRLVLPRVVVRVSPVGEQLVGLPTWLWVDASGWRPVSRSVSVPGVSVTATATPESVTWSTGDGATVVCAGPGTPYTDAASPDAVSPDCGHVYRDVSPAGGFTVSATVQWKVAWSGAGRSGVFPGLARTESVAVRVGQAPAVNVTPDGGS